MDNITIGIIITVWGCLWGVVWLVTELRCCQQGIATFDIIRRVYAKYNLSRITW